MSTAHEIDDGLTDEERAALEDDEGNAAGATASTDITLGNGGVFRKLAFYTPKLTDAELQAFSK